MSQAVDHIRTMLNKLRVFELQELLTEARLPRAGRKPELVDRAFGAIQGDPRLVEKLKWLYSAKTPPYPVRPTPYEKPNTPRINSRMPLPVTSTVYGQANKRGLVPVDVKFCPLAFYDSIDTIVRPAYLRDMSSSLYSRARSDRCVTTVNFQLTPTQIEHIGAGRTTRYGKLNGAQDHFSIQIQLRFCKLETSCQQKDKYPSMCTVTVNNNVVPLPAYAYSAVDVKKQGQPLDITQYCRLKAYDDNNIKVTWMKNVQQPQQYTVQVTLVKELSSSDLLHRLKNKGIRNTDHSRALIKDKLKNSPESEVALTSLRASLLCPLGKMRITLPCRGILCNHLQCFDGILYIQMNEKKSSWICPVCDQQLPFDNLIVDGLFNEILNANPSSNEIEFLQDGSWKVMKHPSESNNTVVHSQFGSPASCNGLEGPDAIVAGLSRKQGSSTVMSPILSPVPASAGSSSSKPVVIDLTDLDSDDESSRPQKDCTSPLLTNFHSTLPPPYPPVMTSPQFSLQSTVYSSIPFLEEGPSQTVAGGGHSCFSLFDMPELFPSNPENSTDVISVD